MVKAGHGNLVPGLSASRQSHRDEQERSQRSLSDTLIRPPRLSLARSTTSEEQRHKRQQRRDRHWEKLPLHSATVQHATEKSLKTAIGGASDPAALHTSSLAPSTFTDGLPPTAPGIYRLGPGLYSLGL